MTNELPYGDAAAGGTACSSLLAAASVASFAYLGWLLSNSPEISKQSVFLSGIVVWLTWCAWAIARFRPVGQRLAFFREYADVHVLLIVLIYGFAVLRMSPIGITSDGGLYFGYLRSLVFDGDLQIGPELEFLRQTGRHHYVVPIGPMAVWAPLYLAVYLVDTIARVLGWSAPPASAVELGLTGPYVRAALFTSFLLAAGGLVVMHLRLRREFPRLTALTATLLLYAGTTLLFYTIYEPSLPHPASFGLAALFVVYSERLTRDRSLTGRDAILLGGLYGLMCVVRPQNALFIVFPIAWQSRALEKRLCLRPVLLFALGAAPFALLQGAMAYALLSQQSYSLLGEGGYLRPWDSHWLDVLFSSWHGLFSWTPIAYVAFLGTLLYWRRNRRWSTAALAVFAAMCWVNGSAEDWHGSWAFGARRFTSTLVVLAPGLAAAVALVRKRPMLLIAPVAGFAALWNFYLMVQWNKDYIPREAPVSFERIAVQQVRFFFQDYFYPFVFPANVVFSWREGLPLDRYDHLAAITQTFGVGFDAGAREYLLNGWSPVRTDTAGSFRTMTAEEAVVIIPLRPPTDRVGTVVLEIRGRALLPASGEVILVAVEVAEQPVGRIAFGEGTFAHRLLTPAAAWRTGLNRLTIRRLGTLRGPASEALPGSADPLPAPSGEDGGVAVYSIWAGS